MQANAGRIIVTLINILIISGLLFGIFIVLKNGAKRNKELREMNNKLDEIVEQNKTDKENKIS